MGIISSLYTRIALLSPILEVKMRQVYWRNSSRLRKYNPNRTIGFSRENKKQVDFEEILKQLKEWGVSSGTLLIVHSSYDSLKCTGLSPKEIIDKLLHLVGNTGTLVMPVIRTYKECPTPEERLKSGIAPPICKYNIMKTPVSSGILPAIMMRYPNAIISKFPLNPLCAIGPLAMSMMEQNINGEYPSPHGVNSCWKFCLDHNALICSLGTNLRHHNTMGHVAEEAFDDWCWNDEEWYEHRRFTIEIPNEAPFELEVKERKPKWGMLHQAEINRYHDFLKNRVVKKQMIGSVLVEFEEAQNLISFLRSKNKNGYPYYE